MLNKAKKGFTLVEIMIVVAIIALLAVIAVPAFVQARLKAQASSCKNNLRQIDGGMDQFALDNNNTAPATVAALSPTYVKAVPVCPAGGTYALGTLGTPTVSATNPTCSIGGTGATGHAL